MAGGLLALLDDVALIARSAASSVDDVAALTAKTSAKAAGVVIDDAAVTPQYVSGVTPARELPMIWRITKGSLRNKLLIILPIALLLNAFAPWALTPILMVGGAYLCFEGAEKIVHKLTADNEAEQERAVNKSEADEDALVQSAITTDLILSAEIMIISLDGIKDQSVAMQFAVLVAVGVLITAAVYGAVGLLVKIDDIGRRWIEKDKAPKLGHAMVKGMPHVLNAIGVIGTIAMLWVGGHLIVRGFHEVFGWHWPHDIAERGMEAVGGGFAGWMVETGVSLVAGLITGFIVLAVVTLAKRVFGADAKEEAATH
ncbi:ABC transporter [Corynebacterium sp. BCW_4722]|nr:ABC transporter [Corynebacterium sp. BCW_4722]